MASTSSNQSKYTTNEIRTIMASRHNVRNITILGHVDHGKTTIFNSLMVNGSGSRIGGCVVYEREGNKYLFHLLDTPGQVDLSFEVTTSLRITDGALVVVDCVEGVQSNTESLVFQALEEGICPVLVISKVDRLFVDLQLDGEEAYRRIKNIIEKINCLIGKYGGGRVCPQSVSFVSGLHGWGFTLKCFAKMWSKLGWDESLILNRLWGENYFDPKTNMWTDYRTGSSTCKRGFVFFCYDVIDRIITSCIVDSDREKLWPRLERIGVCLMNEEKKLTGKRYMICVLQSWLPGTSALAEMIIEHLPSPCIGQYNRVERLYMGPPDDRFANAIRNCDPEGPLIVYVSRLVPDDKGSFFALGRVFSGKVSPGMNVWVIRVDGVQGVNDLHEECVKDTAVWVGNRQVSLLDVPSGSILVLVGVQNSIEKAATLINEGANDAFAIRPMMFAVAPLVHVSLTCSHKEQNRFLSKGLWKLRKSDPLVVFFKDEEYGKTIIHVSGELHLRSCIKYLESQLKDCAKVLTSVPVVSYRETVLEASQSVTCFSANRNSKLVMEARPLEAGLVDRIVGGLSSKNPKQRNDILCEDFNWEKDDARRIWSFAPDHTGPNLLLDLSKGMVRTEDSKKSIIDAFQASAKKGALAEEEMMGICFDICDASFDTNKTNTGGNSAIVLAKKAIYESQLAASPRLLEPAYLLQIQVPLKDVNGVYKVLHSRHGEVLERELLDGFFDRQIITASLPMSTSFGFSEELRVVTSSQAMTRLVSRHWKMIESDPLEVGSVAARTVAAIRKRKGLKGYTTNDDRILETSDRSI